ncbi:hypothetical protein MLD38_023782 [Melastoma candidum]|uniref:Uncharacterized protein n=1 Tax=Melastoma candidum TaxID=119954 RepID=A0ACB9NQN7_9MYRT|nr:hypothetical protein MLD38_023782 [Melastoma candidum]
MAELENPKVMRRMVRILSSLLENLAESNEREARPRVASVFHGLTRPAISVQQYLERIFKYANCSPCCLVVAYVYLDRFSRRQPSLPINTFNVHRLLIASVLVAVKFMDDIYYNNAYYAKVGGISTAEMNFLEVDYLFGLGFDLSISPTTFYDYYNNLLGRLASSKCPRGIEPCPVLPESSPGRGLLGSQEGGAEDRDFSCRVSLCT